MKLPPVFLKLTTNSCRGGTNEPIFVAPEDIVTFAPCPVRDQTIRDSKPVDGAMLTIRGRATNEETGYGYVYVLEPVDEIAELIGKAHHEAMQAVNPRASDAFPGYKRQPYVTAPDQDWINQVRQTRDGMNDRELYGDHRPPYGYAEVKDALWKATGGWHAPRACPEHRYNPNFGRDVFSLVEEARKKRQERREPVLELRVLAGSEPTEPHGRERTFKPPVED